jgi:hypothetical protein
MEAACPQAVSVRLANPDEVRRLPLLNLLLPPMSSELL